MITNVPVQSSQKIASQLSVEKKLKVLKRRNLPIKNPTPEKKDILISRPAPISVQQYSGEEPEEISDDEDDTYMSFIQSVRANGTDMAGAAIFPVKETKRPKLPPGTVGFKLGISADLIPILKEISNMSPRKPIFAVQAPTGVGKSIGIPWIIIKKDQATRSTSIVE